MKTTLCFICIITSFNLFASGKAIFIKGEIYKGKQKLTKGSTINEGEVLIAGKDSLGVFRLNEGTTFKLNANSQIKVAKIATKSTGSWLRLLKGNVFVKYDKAKKNGLKLTAKKVSMAVRGTEFFASYNNDDVWMCVNEGKVSVKSPDDKKPTLVNAGQGILAEKGTKTTPPKEYPWTKKLNWEMDPSKGSLESEIKIEDAYSNPLDVDYD